MRSVKIKYNKEAREAFKTGVDKNANAVKGTLGPTPRIALIDQGGHIPKASDDGVMIAESIYLEDPWEDMGASMIRQVTAKMDEVGGDGTTTAAVLAQKMVEVIISLELDQANEIRAGMEKARDFVLEKLNEHKHPAHTMIQLQDIATTSSLDSEAGMLIAQIIDELGPDSAITVEHLSHPGIEKAVVKGLRFNKGFVDPWFITDPDRLEAVIENPAVLITDIKISAINSLLPILEALIDSGKRELLIVAAETTGEALGMLIDNKLRGKLNVIVVNAPGYHDHRKDLLEDMAIMTGAQVISTKLNRVLEETQMTDLGSASKVVVTKNHTTIIGGQGRKEAIEKRANDLKTLNENSLNEFEKIKLRDRIASLVGGIGIIKVGTLNENDFNTKKQKIEDAINATKAAAQEGILPGGGIALIRIGNMLKNAEFELTENEKKGVGVITMALAAPFMQLCENGGQSFKDLWLYLKEEENFTKGYDFRKNIYTDLITMGIVDPAKVTRLAFLSAFEIANTVLNLGTMIVQNEIEKPLLSSG